MPPAYRARRPASKKRGAEPCNGLAGFASLDAAKRAIIARLAPVSPGSSRLPSLVDAVREFVERDVRPTASALEHADRYPRDLVERMARMGLFGALVPAQYGGLGLDVSTYARIIEELCRGFMSLAGVINSHTMAALIVYPHGTEEQRLRLLPRFASGQARGGLCLTEPHAGSDVQAIRTVARPEGAPPVPVAPRLQVAEFSRDQGLSGDFVGQNRKILGPKWGDRCQESGHDDEKGNRDRFR